MDAAQAYPKADIAPTAAALARLHAGRMLIHDWPAHERPRERLLAGYTERDVMDGVKALYRSLLGQRQADLVA